MKLAKRIAAAVLSAGCAFSLAIPAFSASDINAVSIQMGDLNHDGKVTASDARLALRVSAKLEENKYDVNSYDTDANGKLTASDARTILRVSAKLQKFTAGFDENRLPNALNAFKAKQVSTNISLGDEMSMKIAMYNGNIYINVGQMIEGIPISGMLFIGDKIYLAGDLSKGETSALEIPEDMYDELMSDSEQKEFIANISDLLDVPEDFDSIDEVTLNGQTAIRFSAFKDGAYFGLYTDTMGIPLKEVYGTYTETAGGYDVTATGEIGFDSFTGNVDPAIFDINNYTVM